MVQVKPALNSGRSRSRGKRVVRAPSHTRRSSGSDGNGAAAADAGPKRSVQGQVYEELKRCLMTGVFTPGEKISLRRLTEQTGTSMMPVREAVNRLIAERAFQVVPKRKVIVPTMTAEKFEEITRWRVLLETSAVKTAAQRITPEILTHLEEIDEQIIQAVQEDRRDNLLPLNFEFHFTIYRAAQFQVLLPMIESLWLQAGPFTYYSTPSPRTLWDVHHHQDLIDALQRRDENAAQAALKADIETAARFLQRIGLFAKPRMRRVA